jgi:hypothetical protein
MMSVEKRIDYIPLAPGSKIKLDSAKNETWRIIVNTIVESDI